MLKLFTVFIFIFLKGGNFTVIVTVSVMFSCGNFSRDIVGLETDEKKILLCEAIGHSFKLVNLDFVSILTGLLNFAVCTNRNNWHKMVCLKFLPLLFLLWSLLIPGLQNIILTLV